MEFEKYTERARGFVQSAQMLAQREGHQQFTPEHLLKVIIEDEEGLAANLIAAAGGQPQLVLQGVEGHLFNITRANPLYFRSRVNQGK